MKNEESTTSLLKHVSNITDVKSGDDFLNQHKHSKNLPDFWNEYLSAHPSLKLSDIIRESQVSREYAYEIISGRKSHPGRDRVIALCFSAGMDYNETNRALTLSGNNPLYIKNDRDAAIIMCINFKQQNKKEFQSIIQVNEFLSNRGYNLIAPSTTF